MMRAKLILTDSGGIQEEAPAFGIPVLVMRELTERPEGIEANLLKLVGTDTDTIVESAGQLLDDEAAYNSMAKAANPFGDGHAAERIVEGLLAYSYSVVKVQRMMAGHTPTFGGVAFGAIFEIFDRAAPTWNNGRRVGCG